MDKKTLKGSNKMDKKTLKGSNKMDKKTLEGYKIFNPDWTCRGFQYKVGESYHHEGEIELCRKGFHFCTNPVDLFYYYSFNKANHVAKIIATGEIKTYETNVDEGDSKHVTNNIKIKEEISWEELLRLVNSGQGNSGYKNSGNNNSGYRNSGDFNSGHGNSGIRNSGDVNSGDNNSGDFNSGDRNSGYGNSGDRNSGDFNYCNNSSGAFCTKTPKINIFDEPTNLTLKKWRESKAYEILSRLQLTEWIDVHDYNMSEQEKKEHPEYKIQNGYLKEYDYKKAWKILWSKLTNEEKDIVKGIPNFNKDKFEKITGIEVK